MAGFLSLAKRSEEVLLSVLFWLLGHFPNIYVVATLRS